ncbi:putative conserved oligomeric Golgi complex subunit 6 [Paratrimastix pyriformis]|uniref:Conserved oligomeric Golgi complex subunit 6 n=1 Tax=Paratrimastix pyriformis TaxID=342808 RepID=A0ABQ8UJC7_9EUKA|nr:putative conserved oligomeric Golgi complex subunit 6 [Paratrimastix pyriformis]
MQDMLQGDVEAHSDTLVREEVATIFRRCRLSDVLYRCQGATTPATDRPGAPALSSYPGCSQSQLAQGMAAFYGMLFSAQGIPWVMCEQIADLDLRSIIKGSCIKLLGAAYQAIYDGVSNPHGGYPDAPKFLLHTPDQIASILELEAV